MNQAPPPPPPPPPPGRLVRVSSFSPREADIRFLYSSPDILQNSNFYFVILAPHFLAWFKETCLSKTAPSAQNNTGRFAICQGHSTLFFLRQNICFRWALPAAEIRLADFGWHATSPIQGPFLEEGRERTLRWRLHFA